MLAKRSAGRLSNSRIACCTSDKSVTCQYCSFPCFTFVSVIDRKSTRLNSSHDQISYAVFCLKKKKKKNVITASNKPKKQNTASTKVDSLLHNSRERNASYTELFTCQQLLNAAQLTMRQHPDN